MRNLALSLNQLREVLSEILGYQPEEEILEILYEELVRDNLLTDWQEADLIERFKQISFYFS